jgi:hypothetical protein
MGQTFMAKATIPTQANPNVVATTSTNNVYASTEPMHKFDDVEGVEDVFIIGLSKKEKTIIQCKARKAIVSKACEMALERKVEGLKPLFVTCDSARKPKPHHQNI